MQAWDIRAAPREIRRHTGEQSFPSVASSFFIRPVSACSFSVIPFSGVLRFSCPFPAQVTAQTRCFHASYAGISQDFPDVRRRISSAGPKYIPEARRPARRPESPCRHFDPGTEVSGRKKGHQCAFPRVRDGFPEKHNRLTESERKEPNHVSGYHF